MGFLEMFGADRLVIFSPSRPAGSGEAVFQTMCECYNQMGETAGKMRFPAGLHHHLNQTVQVEPEVDRCTAMTDPKLFSFAPDTAHLHLAGMDVPKVIARYKSRLMLLDYKDAKRDGATFKEQIFDLGDGEIDFPACNRILTAIGGSRCRASGPRASYERCRAYVVNRLDRIEYRLDCRWQ